MSVDPSNNAKDIFLAAIEMELPADRDSFVRETCGSDLALRQRVDALILAHEAPESLLDRRAPEIVDSQAIDPTAKPAYLSKKESGDISTNATSYEELRSYLDLLTEEGFIKVSEGHSE